MKKTQQIFLIITLATLLLPSFSGFSLYRDRKERKTSSLDDLKRDPIRAKISQDLRGNNQESNESTDDYDIFRYVNDLMDLGFTALNVIVMIIVLSLSVAFVIWWVLFVFKILPRMLADLTKRIDESYGFMGVFVFVVLFFPSLLVFIINFMISNIELLTTAIRSLLGGFSDQGESIATLRLIIQKLI
ncbi:MAG: hypothetical protein ACFFFH_09210 [Candidatus Thorarchaeota archaeon]